MDLIRHGHIWVGFTGSNPSEVIADKMFTIEIPKYLTFQNWSSTLRAYPELFSYVCSWTYKYP